MDLDDLNDLRGARSDADRNKLLAATNDRINQLQNSIDRQAQQAEKENHLKNLLFSVSQEIHSFEQLTKSTLDDDTARRIAERLHQFANWNKKNGLLKHESYSDLSYKELSNQVHSSYQMLCSNEVVQLMQACLAEERAEEARLKELAGEELAKKNEQKERQIKACRDRCRVRKKGMWICLYLFIGFMVFSMLVGLFGPDDFFPDETQKLIRASGGGEDHGRWNLFMIFFLAAFGYIGLEQRRLKILPQLRDALKIICRQNKNVQRFLLLNISYLVSAKGEYGEADSAWVRTTIGDGEKNLIDIIQKPNWDVVFRDILELTNGLSWEDKITLSCGFIPLMIDYINATGSEEKCSASLRELVEYLHQNNLYGVKTPVLELKALSLYKQRFGIT